MAGVIQVMKHTCCWVNHSDFTRRETMYCGKPVAYRMVADDDGRRVRKYDDFCPEHQKKSEAQCDCMDCQINGENTH